ncbi:hypothetical protein DL96DRAFT_115967 [Flagelloscypha sp. PMI_526]|nr:hypothetical protein DL96DRAFT_115967 [Flagelloscypha sp. PMI_526]
MFNKALLTISVFLATAFAKPTARQSTCWPDFGGRDVSITVSNADWGVPSVANGQVVSMVNPGTPTVGEWAITYEGTEEGVYQIRPSTDSSLVIAQQVHSDLLILSPNGITTLGFRINCATCTDPTTVAAGDIGASDCTIIRQGNEHCATFFYNGPGHSPGLLELQQCPYSGQSFSFALA